MQWCVRPLHAVLTDGDTRPKCIFFSCFIHHVRSLRCVDIDDLRRSTHLSQLIRAGPKKFRKSGPEEISNTVFKVKSFHHQACSGADPRTDPPDHKGDILDAQKQFHLESEPLGHWIEQ